MLIMLLQVSGGEIPQIEEWASTEQVHMYTQWWHGSTSVRNQEVRDKTMAAAMAVAMATMMNKCGGMNEPEASTGCTNECGGGGGDKQAQGIQMSAGGANECGGTNKCSGDEGA